jgi:hypothetical protein
LTTLLAQPAADIHEHLKHASADRHGTATDPG